MTRGRRLWHSAYMKTSRKTIAMVKELAASGVHTRRIALQLSISTRSAARHARGVEFIGPTEHLNRGGFSGGAALSEEEVDKIRALLAAGAQSQVSIAMEHGITQSSVSAIARGRAWGWLPNPHGPSRSSPDVLAKRADDVRRRLGAGEPLARIAKSYGCTAQALRYWLRPAGSAPMARRGAPFTAEQGAEAVRRYADGQSLNEIRKAMGLRTTTSIHRALVKAGVRLRPVGSRYDYARARAARSGGGR